jgi:predicted permease
MGSLISDIRCAVRALRRSPGFVVAALLTLAFGMGASTAIFTMFDAFLLRTLPVKEPSRLALINRVDSRGRTESDFPSPVFARMRDANGALAGIFAYDATRVSVTAHGEAEFVDGDFVTGNYFEVLGVNAAKGRALTAADDQPGSEPAAVISDPYWRRRFGADPAVLGTSITVGGTAFQIVGIMPPRFFGRRAAGKAADVILPMFLQARLGLKDHTTFQLMARLKPVATLAQASAELDSIYRNILESAPASQARTVERIVLRPGIRGDTPEYDGLTDELRVLLAIVGVGLIIASLNVANLLLARGMARQSELTIRLAIGASRARVVRQLFVESVLLGVLGGAAGLLLGHWFTAGLVYVLSFGREPVVFEMPLDARVLLFSVALSLVTSILFGLAPALAGARQELNTVLKGSDRTGSPAAARRVSMLIVPQAALSVVLLMGAGTIVRGLQDLYRFEPGFERKHVVMGWIFPVLNGYDRLREIALYRDLSERIAGLPGVDSASVARLRLVFGTSYRNVTEPGAGPATTIKRVYCNQVGPRFFETMRIPLRLGREFSRSDVAGAPPTAIISERLSGRLFNGRNPIGRPVILGVEGGDSEMATVIGVAGDIRHHPGDRESGEAVYVPYPQAQPDELGQMNILARTSNPSSVIPELRQALREFDRNLPLEAIETQESEIDEYLSNQRSLATLSTVFAAVALLLTAIGLYGTMSYAVRARTRELGIRLALGANPNDLIRMILGNALRQVGLGLSIGIPGAFVATRFARSALIHASSPGPLTLGAVVCILGAVALAAAWLPARRAAVVDPVASLQ